MSRARYGVLKDFEDAKISGGHCGGVTPVPISNTAVKPARADGTWRGTSWESRSPPEYSNDEARQCAYSRRRALSRLGPIPLGPVRCFAHDSSAAQGLRGVGRTATARRCK